MSALTSPYEYDWTIKYIIIGDMGTGKSCLLQRFIHQKYVQDVPHTIGVEFGARCIQVDTVKIKLQIWDTAGQERFRSVTRSYYRGAAGCIVVYDITRRSTYLNVTRWLSDARSSTTASCVIMLIGNKSDLEVQREVSREEAAEFARDHGILFVETSAKSGDTVDELFIESSRRIYELVQNKTIDPFLADSGVQRKRSAHTIEERTPGTYGYGANIAGGERQSDRCSC